MKNLIGGIVCLLIGLWGAFGGNGLIDIEVNGERKAISDKLSVIVSVALIAGGIALIAARFLNGG